MRYLLPIVSSLALLPTAVRADVRTECPSAKPCKILVLTEEEQNVLIGDKGILQTAAAARSLDLGAVSAYFQQKIAVSPAGDAKTPVLTGADPGTATTKPTDSVKK